MRDRARNTTFSRTSRYSSGSRPWTRVAADLDSRMVFRFPTRNTMTRDDPMRTPVEGIAHHNLRALCKWSHPYLLLLVRFHRAVLQPKGMKTSLARSLSLANPASRASTAPFTFDAMHCGHVRAVRLNFSPSFHVVFSISLDLESCNLHWRCH